MKINQKMGSDPVFLFLAEAAGYVLCGQVVAGGGEEGFGGADFDEVAEVEEGGALRDSGGL